MGKRGYNLGEVSLIIVILIILVAMAAYSVMAACFFEGKIYHGVKICGIYYTCGNLDGVCPEDFGVDCCAADCPMADPDPGCQAVCAGVKRNASITLDNPTCSAVSGRAYDPDSVCDINVTLSFNNGSLTRTKRVLASGAGETFTYNYERDILEMFATNVPLSVNATALGVGSGCIADGSNNRSVPKSTGVCGYFNYLRGNRTGVYAVAWLDRQDIYKMNSSQSACVRPNGNSQSALSCISGFNVGAHDNYAVCSLTGTPGLWHDPDASSTACGYCGLSWLPSGESVVFGEYPSTIGTTECCGDDAGEYPISGICCNLATDTNVGGVCTAAGTDILPTGSFSSASCSVASGTARDDNSVCAINVTLVFDGILTKRVLASGVGGAFTYNYERDVLALIGNNGPHTIVATALGVDASCIANGLNTVLLPNPRTINTCGYFNWFRGSSVAWADNTNIFRLCALQSDCLNRSNISRSSQFCTSGFNVGAHDNYAVCSPAGGAGLWYDPDISSTACGYCLGLSWLRGGETAPFGEYDTGTSTECCGDDANEYITIAGVGPTRCCNASTDVVDAAGNCRDGTPENPVNGNCADGIDNDGNGFNDWDTASWSDPPRNAYHGDPGCPVGAGIVSVSNNAPFANTIINVTCSVNAGNTNVDSVYAYIDNDRNNMFTAGDVDCGWIDVTDYWFASNTRVNINCNVGAAGPKWVVCDVYNSSTEPYDRSFQSGTSGWLAINVQSTACSNYHNSGSCGAVPGCTWYDECRSQPMMLSSYDGALDHGSCVPSASPAPSYSCDVATCGEECSASNNLACADFCDGNIWNNRSECNLSSCSCVDFTKTDCDNFDCNAASITCVGSGTNSISEQGADYRCVGPPTGCGSVGTKACSAIWPCSSGNSCALRACGGATYQCHYNAGSWRWTPVSAMPAVETNCSDGYDNNCAGGVDCLDATCTRDANPNCCLNITLGDTTVSSRDRGLGWGSDLFDHPTNYDANPLCCGNNPNEWFFNFTPATACCDEPTDCVRYVPAGACENHDFPQGILHDEHCNNTYWDKCNLTYNGNRSGTYFCGFDASNGGWSWRTSMPAENCSDEYDNDGDGLISCDDHDDCDGVCPFCPVPEICNNDKDDDCDGLIDGLDPDCPEGSGSSIDSEFRGCDDGIDNDGDGFMDEDEPECADVCEGVKDGRVMMWDNRTYPVNAFGAPCGVPFSSWDDTHTYMEKHCCGNDPNEHYKNTLMNTNPFDDSPVLHACCDAPGDCVDAGGNCQKGSEGVGDLTDCFDGIDNDCDGLTDEDDVDNCTGGTLTGYIFDEKRNPVGGAVVTASPPILGSQYERHSYPPSYPDGSYRLSNPVVGTYNFIARKAGYDDNITKITILAGVEMQQNFTLRNGSCHGDCTDYYGNCNPACDGMDFVIGTDANGQPIINQCNFVDVCAYRPKGFVVKELISGDCQEENCLTTVKQTVCCEGESATAAYPVIYPKITGNVSNVRIVSKMVRRGTEWIKINLAVWTDG